MPRRIARAWVVLYALAALLLGSGCAIGPDVVTREDVAAQIDARLKDSDGNKPESVRCPDDLRPKVGATSKCTMTVDGQQVDVEVTVTSVDGDNVTFDMVAVVDRDDVVAQITHHFTDTGHPPQSVTCPGDLKAIVGASLDCTMTIDGRPLGVNVTVTRVNGGDVKFDFKVDD